MPRIVLLLPRTSVALGRTSTSSAQRHLHRTATTQLHHHHHHHHHHTMPPASSRLSGKTILITGASSGIGRATAHEFSRAAADTRLILAARRIDALHTVAAEIAQASGGRTEVLPVKLDVSDPAQVRGFFADTLPADWRDIDVLVNNAGLVKGIDRVGGIQAEDIDTMVSTNVLGLINVPCPPPSCRRPLDR